MKISSNCSLHQADLWRWEESCKSGDSYLQTNIQTTFDEFKGGLYEIVSLTFCFLLKVKKLLELCWAICTGF